MPSLRILLLLIARDRGHAWSLRSHIEDPDDACSRFHPRHICIPARSGACGLQSGVRILGRPSARDLLVRLIGVLFVIFLVVVFFLVVVYFHADFDPSGIFRTELYRLRDSRIGDAAGLEIQLHERRWQHRLYDC